MGLSPAQESMWLDQLLHPESVNGGIFSVLVRGPVTAGQLRAACLAVCAQSPQLRGLVVPGEGGGPARIAVHPAERVLRFETVAVPAPPGAELTVARQWHRTHRLRPWRLTEQPPIAFALLDHGGQRRTLVVAVHHIAFDGRSKFVFARRFLQALGELRSPAGLREREPVALPEHPSIDAEAAAVVEHWLAADLPHLPGLVLPRRESPLPAGGRVVEPTPRFELPAETCARLAALTGAAGVSFFTGLVAGVAARLHEYGNTRFVLGIPADTSEPGTREQIGLQVNVVPCLLDIPAGASFTDLLAVSGRALALVQRYRRVPFGWVLRQLRQRHGVDVTRGAFDGVGVSYPRVVRELGEVPGLACEWDFFAPNSTQSFDLTLQLRREGGAAYGRLDHSTLALDGAAAGRFTAGYARLLAALTAEPGRPVAELFEAGPEVVVPAGVAGVAVRDEVLGVLGYGLRVGGEEVLVGGVAGRRYRVVTAEGRGLPQGVPGLLAFAGDGRVGRRRAWIDSAGRVRLLGTAGQLRDWMGRRLDLAEAEAALAGLPGVRSAAVGLTGEAGALRATVTLETAGTDLRAWRRAVRGVWPSGWPQVAEVRLVTGPAGGHRP
ncbi:hypothetical protein CFP65_0778 [Kitasatospora sp. MMS16-BH015]|nr:hypothetical protein CFP65_0778 [Kitasatospora sp. MMS16-BH015]